MRGLVFALVALSCLASCVSTPEQMQQNPHFGEYSVRMQESAFYLSTLPGSECLTSVAHGETLDDLSTLLEDGETVRLYLEFAHVDEIEFRAASILDFGDGPFVSSAARIRYAGEEYFTDCNSAALVELTSFRRAG